LTSVYIENSEVVDLELNDPIKVSYKEQVGTEPTGISHPELLTVQADVQHSGTIVNGISRIGTMTGGHSARFKDEDMADTYLNKAIDFINESKDQPFFMYFAAHDNHVPRRPHPRFQGSSDLGPRGDAIVQFDWTVGKLIKTLKSKRIYKNTLIILSSDNGPVLFDGYWEGSRVKNGTHKAAGPFRGGKYSLWEGGTRMPFIVSWPGKIEAGTSSALVSQVDIFASLATLVNKKLPAKASPDGQNMLPALMGKSSFGREYLVEEALSQVALRMGDWKFIPPGTITERGGLDEWIKTPVHPPGMLFNLADDPGERNNLAQQHPKRVQKMLAILKKEAPSKFLKKKTPRASQLGFE
jgi:arylsulfatase A